MRKRISEKTYTAAVRGPKTRYGSLSVNATGRVAAARALPRGWRCVWFQTALEVEDDGVFYRDKESYVVTMFVDGIASVLFYVEDGALASVCFSFLLKPLQIRDAIRAMRANGLGRFVGRAAQHTLAQAPKSARPAMESVLNRYVPRRVVRVAAAAPKGPREG